MTSLGVVRTVLGDVEASALGVTYAHEHLISSPPLWKARQDLDLVLDDVEKAIEEVRAFSALGGQSLFEATAADYGRDVQALRAISHETGVNIIACGGLNKGLWFHDLVCAWSDEQLLHRFVDETTTGVDGTDIRAGVLKFGTGYNSVSEDEERVIRAAARAHRATGVPLHGHTEAGTMALEQLEILHDEGVDLRRACITHLSRNPDPWYLRKVAETGAFLGFDGLSKVKYFPENVRIDAIVNLCSAGFSDQILLGGDLARRSDLAAYERGPGLSFVLGKWVPRLREELGERGWTDDHVEQTIQRLLVANPRRYFELTEPY